MSHSLNFALAESKDEAELRALLQRQSLPGWVSLSFEREPEYFAASTIDGERHSVLLARDMDSGRLVGFSSRAVRRVYINGEVHRLGYLGQLRIDADYAGGYRVYRSLSQAFNFSRQLQHQDDELAYDITSILSDNLPALRLLTAGLPGMPRYLPLSGFNTLVLRTRRVRRACSAYTVDNGEVAGLPAITKCLQRNYQRYQFAPYWDEAGLLAAGLSAGDFLVICEGKKVVACAALWDQRAVKQTVVRDYRGALRMMRSVVNLLAPLWGLPRLPPRDSVLSQGWFSHISCDEDNVHLAQALLSAAVGVAKERGLDQLVLGLADDHPLLLPLRKHNRHLCYRSKLFLIQWGDGESATLIPDDRPLHVEVATL